MSAYKFAPAYRPALLGRKHMVSSGHYLASQAALQILEAGGNAIDAGVCGGLVLNVVEPQMCSFTGVAPIMIYLAEEERVITLDGLGTWPALATLERIRQAGGDVVPEGILQTVVPGAASSWLTALQHYGTMPFSTVARIAIEFAKDGFIVDPMMALTIQNKIQDFPQGSEAAKIFLPEGRAPQAGDLFRQQDLANTFEHLIAVETANLGKGRAAAIAAVRDDIYRGDLAATFVKHQVDNGGLLRAADLAGYVTSIEPAVSIDFSGSQLYSCGPWCQGPTLLQILRLFQAADVRGLKHNSVEYLHFLLEAIKLVAADREAYYGDPRFVNVPMDTLLSPEYALERLRDISLARAAAGMPLAGRIDGFDIREAAPNPRSVPSAPLDTSYICAVDRHGNAFSATPSDGIMRKSPIVPGTGMSLSPRGIQSRTSATHPASVAPGKRPRLTPNPAMAIKPGEFVMPFGTPGGDLQVQAMSQVILNMFIFGMPPQQAVEEARVYSYSYPDSFAPHAYYPGRVKVEDGIDEDVKKGLRDMGHDVQDWPATEWPRTGVCITMDDLRAGIKVGAADCRRMSYALGC